MSDSVPAGSILSHHEMPSDLVASPVAYDLLRPADCPAGAPVMLWLHGGDGPDDFASRTRPAFEQGWADGTLQPLSVVMPHSTRSFRFDGVGEDAAWETMLTQELLPHARAAHDAGDTTVVGGVSMGGLGSLRLAFRHPDRFVAVAALDPVDPDRSGHDHPLAVVESHATEIAANGLAVYFECGDEDMLDLHRGVEALHRRMWDMGLRHEYRSVRGANHLGRSLGPRVLDALGFIGRAIADPTPDPEIEFAAGFVPGAHEASGSRRRRIVEGPAGPIEVGEYGDGEPVLMLPSLGRGAADFDDLARRLARAGYHAIHPEPRGIGGSTGDLTALSMADLAADAAAVIHAVADGPVTIVGHAFGNRVARMTATDYPHLVDSVVLLCCGGAVRPAPEYEKAVQDVFNVELSDEDHLEAVRSAFFADGNDPSVWFDGWHGVVAACQGAATADQPVEYWWGAGGKDVFVVQPLQDVMAVPENAHRLCDEFGDRVSVVTIDNAGHALLPEQPDAVEVALRMWLTRSR